MQYYYTNNESSLMYFDFYIFSFALPVDLDLISVYDVGYINRKDKTIHPL